MFRLAATLAFLIGLDLYMFDGRYMLALEQIGSTIYRHVIY